MRETLAACAILAVITVGLYFIGYEAICSNKCGRHRNGFSFTSCCCTKEIP
jgi:hypothetical protein